MEELIRKLVGISVFCSILDIFTEKHSDIHGFRTVCGLAMMLTVIYSVRALICG